MTFGSPYYLWLLLAIPPGLILFFWWSERERKRLMARFIQARLLSGLIKGTSAARQKIRAGLFIAAAVSLILALAEPRWGYDMEEITQRGLDIVVAVDTSKSMLSADIAPNRLARAKLAALDLMKQAKLDRLGLVAFAGSAFLQCPLTVDDVVFRQSVETLDVNTIPDGGTALADAIETAALAFKEGDNYKVLVLLTDGEDHDSGALAAAKKAAEGGLRIFTIGIGTAEGDIPRLKNARGNFEPIHDAEGNVVKSHLNEPLLQEIAGAAKGFYLPLRGADPMGILYQKGLAPLPKTESKEKWVKRLHEHYHWPLAAAIALLIVEIFFPERKSTRPLRFSRRAATEPASATGSSARSGASALAILAAIGVANAASASPSQALRDYQAGRYDEAAKEYEKSIQQAGKQADPRLHFNAGAAAYQQGKFDQAARYFTNALSARDVDIQQRAYYNLGNALYRSGEKNANTKEKKEFWEGAAKQYLNAIQLNTNDADAAFNYRFVTNRLEQLKEQQQQQQKQPDSIQPSDAAKKAKAAADAAVKINQYAQALKIMTDQEQIDPTTKYYNDYIQRLKEVNGVQENSHP